MDLRHRVSLASAGACGASARAPGWPRTPPLTRRPLFHHDRSDPGAHGLGGSRRRCSTSSWSCPKRFRIEDRRPRRRRRRAARRRSRTSGIA
ncbi:MAG: hypothetical protein MZV64_72810 [Ignavibacteriales bacterium]|nr:hypothetical protein [Ignavibacteriales bacterium]